MFATPLVSPVPGSLVSHVFGRFLARTPPGGRMNVAPIGAETPATPRVLEDDEIDLAQRVREMGEW